MLKEFKEFALRGNLVDLAIGFIIGAAFSGLVQSVVNDIVMPIIGLVTGGIDFSNLYIQLAGEPQPTLALAREAGATLAYGNFITLVINFLIVAWVLLPGRQGDEPDEAAGPGGPGDARAAAARGGPPRGNPRPSGQEIVATAPGHSMKRCRSGAVARAALPERRDGVPVME